MFVEPGAPHNQPHFHVYYQKFAAVYSIEPIELMSGGLPVRYKRLVEAWAELHASELAENWELLQSGRLPYKIAPLQ